jgi:hypothetical protein
MLHSLRITSAIHQPLTIGMSLLHPAFLSWTSNLVIKRVNASGLLARGLFLQLPSVQPLHSQWMLRYIAPVGNTLPLLIVPLHAFGTKLENSIHQRLLTTCVIQFQDFHPLIPLNVQPKELILTAEWTILDHANGNKFQTTLLQVLQFLRKWTSVLITQVFISLQRLRSFANLSKTSKLVRLPRNASSLIAWIQDKTQKWSKAIKVWSQLQR